jgi:hypothetical protein
MEEEIIAARENRSWRPISQKQASVKKINLTAPATKRDGLFAIMLSATPKVAVNEAAFTFLTHPDPDHQVIYPHQYTSYQDLGRDINARLREGTSPDDIPRMVVITRHQIFPLWGITGTVYVNWAKTVTRSVVGSEEPPLEMHNVPVLLELTGQMQVRSLVLLDACFTPGPVDLHRVKMLFPSTTVSLFPCEADTRQATESRPGPTPRDGHWPLFVNTSSSVSMRR